MNQHTNKLLSEYKYNSEIIDISNKKISGILDLKNYTKLTRLNCSNNKIISIINSLYSLNYLDCSHNHIITLLNYQI